MNRFSISKKLIAAAGLALVLWFGIGSAACAVDPNPVRQRLPLAFGAVTLQVEMATTDEQQSLGLMFRTKLADSQGMLFVFERDEHHNFWMKNTLIPLSIAYIAATGEITEILDMEAQSLANVPSKFAVRYALELPQGAFGRLGLKVGDKMEIPKL